MAPPGLPATSPATKREGRLEIAALYKTGAELIIRYPALSTLMKRMKQIYPQMTRIYVETQHYGNMFQQVIFLKERLKVTANTAMEHLTI